MTTSEKIRYINQVLQKYFSNHPGSSPVPVKDFVPQLKNLFSSDKTLRQFLRDLRDKNLLQLIPFVLTERKMQKTSWYFAPAKLTSVPSNFKLVARKERVMKPSTTSTKFRGHSDECYVLDICDEVLGLNSVRQHRFPFLVGDPNSAGRCTTLPVDAWYESLNLVIEFNEKQHTESVKLFDKRMTISGVDRAKQRALYDNRKRIVLPQYGIHVVLFSYFDFDHNSRKQLSRRRADDILIIREKLKKYKVNSIE